MTRIAPPSKAGQYVTLLADPPWLERGSGRIKRGADRHYPLMNTRDICALPVRDWMAADSHLYLWVTNNFLPDGLLVMAAWGYRYVTCVTWLKDRMGIGQYFRGITEHCLFGVRGRLPYRFGVDGRRLQGVTGFRAARGRHSEKPETMRRMIERVSPGPYLEMFARRPAPGWDVWGNEASGGAGRSADARIRVSCNSFHKRKAVGPMSELDRLQAELAFTAQRAEELGRELNDAEKAYGSPVNTETIDDVIAGVADVLRRSGNHGLADRYLSAFNRFMSAGREADAAIAREDDGSGGLCEAMNALQEDFDRISSEVAAWLDYKLDERKPS